MICSFLNSGLGGKVYNPVKQLLATALQSYCSTHEEYTDESGSDRGGTLLETTRGAIIEH